MYEEVAKSLSVELGISFECAADVHYLRSRNRWTQELEAELIALHKAGNHPNINEFGCTTETGKALLKEAIAGAVEKRRAAVALLADATEFANKLRPKKDHE